jgi:glutamate-1-semialdehyde 2,1-aminomutase
MINTSNSQMAFGEALKLMPGGVNSPVRAFRGISGHPVFISSAHGSHLRDIDRNVYIDYCLSWGVSIHGHSHAEIIKSAREALDKGSTFGAPTLAENGLARHVISMVPSIEKVRLVNSGTEAVMSAVRLARAYTGRNLILKFDGCYHGHSDGMLIAAGSGLSELFSSQSLGITENTLKDTISVPFNNNDILEQVFEKHGKNIAAIITEPVPANMGLVLPEPGFLSFLQHLAHHYGSLLIFDEVITGFRGARGGMQEYFHIMPDLTILGKIIGGGFPMAAYGGPSEIMDLVAPSGNVYQAGTLSGNPVAVAAGCTALELLNPEGFYENFLLRTVKFKEELLRLQEKYPVSVNFLNGMFSVFFSKSKPTNYQEVRETDASRFPEFYNKLLESGIYFSPGYFETNFISAAHSANDFEQTVTVLNKILKSMYN